MPEKRRTLDIWIVESNTVYRDVPFNVATDWIQQGRLLPEDKARPAGKGDWFLLGDIPAFAVYFPKPEPYRVEDQAEALEPVEVGFTTKRHGDEDDDPDMIPLIDITLVLLIFFMMTAAAQAGLFSPIDTPPAKNQLATIEQGMFWVGVEDEKGEPRYSLGKDEKALRKPAREFEPVRAGLKEELAGKDGEVRIRIRADKKLPHETVREVMEKLGRLEHEINAERPKADGKRVRFNVSGEVSEPQ